MSPRSQLSPLFLPLALAALLASAPALPAPPADAPPRIEVRYDHPERFSEFSGFNTGLSRSDSAAWLKTLQRHITRQADRTLPAGQQLDVTITELKRAGGYEPWHGPQFSDVRIVRDIYPPRIDLSFRLTDADGRELASGNRQLRNPAFMMSTSRYRDDELRYEKALVDDWLRREFGRRS